MDNLALGVGDVDFAGPNYKQDPACEVFFFGRIKVVLVHKIHFAITGIIIEFTLSVKVLRFIEPAIGVVVECDEGDNIRHIEVFGSAKYGVEIIEAGLEPFAGINEVCMIIEEDFRSAIEFAVEMIKETHIKSDDSGGE